VAPRTVASAFSPFANTGGFSGGGLFWIDVDERERTLAAKSDGHSFGPTTIVNTTYRVDPAG